MGCEVVAINSVPTGFSRVYPEPVREIWGIDAAGSVMRAQLGWHMMGTPTG